MDVGDRVAVVESGMWRGRVGTISRNRMNGMFDVDLFPSGETVRCFYGFEIMKISDKAEAICKDCLKEIVKDEGRMIFPNRGTYCLKCGEEVEISDEEIQKAIDERQVVSSAEFYKVFFK